MSGREGGKNRRYRRIESQKDFNKQRRWRKRKLDFFIQRQRPVVTLCERAGWLRPVKD